MDYIIHNAKSIRVHEERKKAVSTIKKQMSRLKRLSENYPKNIVVDLYFNETSPRQYLVSAVINLKGEIMYVKQKGENVEALLYALFDRIRLTLSKKINLERKAYLYQRKDRQFRAFLENLEELQELKRRETKEVFDRMVRVISGDVATYIRRRLKSAEMTTAVKRGKFKVQELMDELFLQVYEHIEEVPEGEARIKAWLYRRADEILAGKFRELEFEQEHFAQLDDLVENEYRQLEEHMTADADQELVLEEDLEEEDLVHERYSADNLMYGEDENSLLDEVTLHLHQDEIHRLIEKALAKLPVHQRTIMDLYLINQMTAEEIAEVKQFPLSDVESVIGEVNRQIKVELSDLIRD